LNEFDFVTLGGVDEGDAAAVGFEMGTVREADTVLGDVSAERLETLDLEGEVGEVRLDLNGAAFGEVAEFDGLVAFGGFEEDEFGSAGGFVASNLLEAEDFAVKPDGTFEVIHAVPGVKELEGESHAVRLGDAGRGGEGLAGIGT